MQEFIQNFHFLRPWLLILLVLPFVLYRCCYNRLDTISSWEKVCDKNLLKYLLIKGSSLQRRLIYYICGLGFISAVIAAAGPCWTKQEAESFLEENPLMIVLNVSSDMTASDVTPNRLARAKYAISDLLTEVKQAQKGLIVYSNEPFLIAPITEDTKLLQNLLPNIDLDIMPTNGDRLDRALKLASESFANSGRKQGEIIVVASDIGQNFAQALQIAKQNASQGYHVNVINVSAEANEKLKKLANSGQGKYININQIAQLAKYLNQIEKGEMKASTNKISQWIDEGYYLCFIPLLCCLYLFRRGIFCLLFCLLLSSPAYAGFFLNDNQEGMHAFNQKQYQTALQKFKDKQWQASSHYRLGNYEKAFEGFSQKTDIESLYNQGNALAKMGKIEDAIKKYEEVLEQNPKHEDAKFNLEYLKQQGQQQSSPDSKNQGDKEQNQDKQQSASSSQSEQKPDENQQPQNNNSDEQKQPQDNKQNASPQSQDDKQDKSDDKNQSNMQQQQQAGQEQDKEDKQKENSGSALQNNDGDNKYDEEVQARELQYREIPEDPGGLLRAFIAQEYSKNRYAKEK